jgi:tRNA/tmRNA/rRNA uracil-C5-methylase (TrmA/RlmC/RlmD family)
VLQDDVANALPRLKAADVAVLDPPRAGAGAKVLERLAALGPRAVALVSCDPAALARDVRILTDLGYHAAWVQPVDLFPQTAHVEAVTCLLREQAQHP